MIAFTDFKAQQKRLGDGFVDKIVDCIESGRYILGTPVDDLENALCDYVKSNYCITCANGTDALLASLMALDIGPGDEIITPAFSYIAATEVIVTLGAKPIFIEVEQNTCNIKSSELSNLITDNTKAVIAVSLFGQPCDLLELKKICKESNIKLIEDGAQSFGAMHNGQKSCSIADISTTSFFPTKPLGCFGDGGAIFTNHEDLSEKIRMIVRHGQLKKYQHDVLGMNSRLDTIQATVLLEKLKILDDEIQKRNEIAEYYNKKLSDLTEVNLPKVYGCNISAIAQYTIQHSNRSEIINKLKLKNIPYAIHYPIPVYKQKFIIERFDFSELQVTEKLCSSVLSLPINPYMSRGDVDEVCAAISN